MSNTYSSQKSLLDDSKIGKFTITKRVKIILISIAIAIVLAVIIGLIVYFATKRKRTEKFNARRREAFQPLYRSKEKFISSNDTGNRWNYVNSYIASVLGQSTEEVKQISTAQDIGDSMEEANQEDLRLASLNAVDNANEQPTADGDINEGTNEALDFEEGVE